MAFYLDMIPGVFPFPMSLMTVQFQLAFPNDPHLSTFRISIHSEYSTMDIFHLFSSICGCSLYLSPMQGQRAMSLIGGISVFNTKITSIIRVNIVR